jgi:hypothetical protein
MDGISSGDDDLPGGIDAQATSGGDMNPRLFSEHPSSSQGPASPAAAAATGDVDASSSADTRARGDSRYIYLCHSAVAVKKIIAYVVC